MENIQLISKIYNDFYIETNLKNVCKYFDIEWLYVNDIKSPSIPNLVKSDPFISEEDYCETLGNDIIRNGTYCPYVIDNNYLINYGQHRLAALKHCNFTKKIFCIKITKSQLLIKNELNSDKYTKLDDTFKIYNLNISDFKVDEDIYCWINSSRILNFLIIEDNRISDIFDCEIGTFYKIKIKYDIEIIIYLHLLYDSIREYIFSYHNTNNKILSYDFLNDEVYYNEYMKIGGDNDHMKNIKCILIDVDGTLTNGKLHIGNNGEEFKIFDVKDGMGIIKAIESDIVIGFITGRNSKSLEIRANELKVKYVYQGNNKKIDIIKEILEKEQITPDETLFIGDDINDYNAMKYVKFSACPSDASSDIINICNYVSRKKGGDGAVRDIIEHVLRLQEKWEIQDECSSYYTK